MTKFAYSLSYCVNGDDRVKISTIDAFDEQSAREQVRGLVPRDGSKVKIELAISRWNRTQNAMGLTGSYPRGSR
jgi:hypothetical protein